jgi:hypothetical protein
LQKKTSNIYTIAMARGYKRRVLLTLQLVSMTMVAGISLFIYNDWRTHRTLAAPETPVHQAEEQPLTHSDQDVNGTIEVGPDGTIHKPDGTTQPGKPAIQ